MTSINKLSSLSAIAGTLATSLHAMASPPASPRFGLTASVSTSVTFAPAVGAPQYPGSSGATAATLSNRVYDYIFPGSCVLKPYPTLCDDYLSECDTYAIANNTVVAQSLLDQYDITCYLQNSTTPQGNYGFVSAASYAAGIANSLTNGLSYAPALYCDSNETCSYVIGNTIRNLSLASSDAYFESMPAAYIGSRFDLSYNFQLWTNTFDPVVDECLSQPFVHPRHRYGIYSRILITYKDGTNTTIPGATTFLAGSFSYGPDVGHAILGNLLTAIPTQYTTLGDPTTGPQYRTISANLIPLAPAPSNEAFFVARIHSRTFLQNGNIDTDNSGRICGSDLALLHAISGNGSTTINDLAYMPEADLDNDGAITTLDFAVLREVGCPADLNCTGDVDDLDFNIFASAYNIVVSTAGDFNGDSVTDDTDFLYFAVAYNNIGCTDSEPYPFSGINNTSPVFPIFPPIANALDPCPPSPVEE
jgi:hypothetical protein